MTEEEKSGAEKYTIEVLNKLYNESETCDADVFAEMRSNTLLVSGHHYKKIARGINRNLRNSSADKQKRLRLVKNHTAKAVSDIKDILASMTPGVLPYPANEHEASHTKAAELAKIIWEDGKCKNNFEEFVEQGRNSFVTIGEAASKVFYNPIGGGLKGYHQAVDKDTKQPLFIGPDGKPTIEPGQVDPVTGEVVGQYEMMPDQKNPEFKPKIEIEKLEPYNLLRHKNAKSMKTAQFIVVRKMVPLDTAKAIVKSSGAQGKELEEMLGWVTEGSKTTYKIFDGTSGSFQDSEGEVMFREFYFRQSPEFPKGYFFITTEKGIIFDGELPFGEYGEVAFPIKWEGYELYEGSCRGFSPIKRLRPSQAEINRCASSISETQVIMGSDKIVLQKGAKFSRGVDMPGMRVYYATDSNPTVIEGRSGDQYSKYLEFNIEELYRLGNIPENSNPIAQNFDPRAELFKKQSQKARFTEPSQRLSRFYRSNCETYLFFSQKYGDSLSLDKVVGPTETPDLAEFKNVDRLSYKVKLMEVSDDLDSAMAKTMELDTILQYAGKDIDPDTLKIILSQYPVVNKTGAFKHLTLDLRNVESDILALDRGEWREPNRYDEHKVYVKYLTSRMKEKDFVNLSAESKRLYAKKLAAHEQFVKMLAEEEMAAQSGFIPSGGALVKADLYVNPDPSNPEKKEKAVYPTEALEWLRKRLEQQGTTQSIMQDFQNQAAVADVSKMLTNSMDGMGDMGFAGGNALAQ